MLGTEIKLDIQYLNLLIVLLVFMVCAHSNWCLLVFVYGGNVGTTTSFSLVVLFQLYTISHDYSKARTVKARGPEQFKL